MELLAREITHTHRHRAMWYAARWLEVRGLRRKGKTGPKKGTLGDCRAELVIHSEEPSVWAHCSLPQKQPQSE